MTDEQEQKWFRNARGGRVVELSRLAYEDGESFSSRRLKRAGLFHLARGLIIQNPPVRSIEPGKCTKPSARRHWPFK